ncbi:MAG TPA: hypothetical protein VD905_14645, partial [Flavobacteriales bacterium]|nr:hypothetical protein [Flavobacteriales bacterium]
MEMFSKYCVVILMMLVAACGGDQKRPVRRIAPLPQVRKIIPKNDLQKMKLEGKVRSMEVNSYVVKEDGVTERSVPGDNAERVSDALFTFNQQGNLLSETTYAGPDRKIVSTKKFEYDEQGLLRRMELKTSDNLMHSLTEFFYDENGLLKEKSVLL